MEYVYAALIPERIGRRDQRRQPDERARRCRRRRRRRVPCQGARRRARGRRHRRSGLRGRCRPLPVEPPQAAPLPTKPLPTKAATRTRKPKRPATCRTRRTTTTRTTRPTARVSANSSDNAHVDSGFDELLPSILFRLEGSGDAAPPRGDVIPLNWDGAGPRPYKRSRGQSRGCPPQSRSSPSRR